MCGSGCGEVLGIAASFIVPQMAPAMLSSLGVTSALGETIGSSIIGGLISQTTGGDFLSGALMSGVGSAWKAGGGIDGISSGTFGNNVGNAFDSTAGSGASVYGFGGNSSGVSATTAGDASSAPSSFGVPANQNSASLILGLNTTSAQDSLITSPMTDSLTGMNGTTGNYGFTNTSPSLVDTVGSAANNPVMSSSLGSTLGKIGLNTDNLSKAVPQLAAGLFNNGPDTSQLSDMLAKQNAMTAQAFQPQVDATNKKAAIGDQLQADASTMDPSYTGRQAQFSTQGAADAAWQDEAQRLRAQGYGENYINAMKQKHDLDTSQATGTAYEQGTQTGLANRNATLNAASSNYQGYSAPSSNISDAKSVQKAANDQASNIAGGVASLFGGTKKNTDGATQDAGQSQTQNATVFG